MEDITAIILTKNEEKNIKECLLSIKGFVQRSLVIDCGSTDSTREIAQEFGAEVLIHPFEYYARQFNWGIANGNIKTTWILRLDADERFTPELNEEVSKILSKNTGNDVNGITVEADYYFLVRCIKHGLRKKRKMMLFKYGIGEIEDRRRDAHSILHSGCSVSAKHRFLHYDFKDISAYIDRYNWYATKEMEDYLFTTSELSGIQNSDNLIKKQRKKKYGIYYKAPMFLRAQLWFVYNYIFRFGFLDGKEGFLFHYFECYWYRMLVDAKILEFRSKHT
jgi:glycosyltransferase involved in cell wall biosynthesis